MKTNAQIFLDKLTTARAHPARIAWIDLHRTPPSVCCFVRCALHKLIPRSITDGLGETMILEHPANVQILKDDDRKSVDQFAAFLMLS